MILATKLRSVFNPEMFQGWGKQKRYFEGWYLKIIDPTETTALAIIPGIAMDAEGHRQAFIQVLDGRRKTAAYFKFPVEDFKPDPRSFKVSINKNSFSLEGMQLDLPDLKGKLAFKNPVPWPNPWYSPGIMGPYTFAPFMECYHGIVSMDHSLEGFLEVKGKKIDFTEGRGYIEKDWGRSFPSGYFWLQSNHFSKPGISLKASVAKIPWVTGAFTGFISGLWLENRLIQFTTYNGTKLERSFADESKVEIKMANKAHRLSILAHRDRATSLASPIHGFMDGRIEESMTATVAVKLENSRTSEVLFEDSGRNVGLEVAGKIEEIFV
jgi:hypothetical protein